MTSTSFTPSPRQARSALPESCPDCGAHFAKGEAAGLREHQRFCASAADGIPLKDEHGNTVGMLGDPDPAKLARHVQWYGPEGAEPWLHLLNRVTAMAVRKPSLRSVARRSRQSSKRPMVTRA